MEKIRVPEHIQTLARTTKYYEEENKSSSYASSYEATSTHPLYVLAKYFLTRSGEKREKILWSMLLKLGIDPLGLPRGTVEKPYDTTHYGSAAWRFSSKPHPALLAAVFDDTDAPLSAAAFLERVNDDFQHEVAEDPKKMQYARDAHSGGLHFDAGELCFLVPPPITSTRICVNLDFRPELAAWYTPGAIAAQLERTSSDATLVRRIADTLKEAGRDTTVLQQAAIKHLKKSTDSSATSHSFRQYGELAMLLKHCDRGELLTFIGDKIKHKRAHALLGVAVPDPPSDILVQGIRMLGGVNGHDAMKYMTRSPTIAELQQCRLKGLMHTLWKMPWPIIEPLVRTYEGDVRSLLLKEAPENLGKARQVFSDHDSRVKLAADNVVEDKNRVFGNFAEFKHGIRSRYTAAQRLHQELQRLDPEVATILLMDHIVPVPHLAEVRTLRNDTGLATALEAWQTPLTTEKWPGSSSARYKQLQY
jgi:hypothetical protein